MSNNLNLHDKLDDKKLQTNVFNHEGVDYYKLIGNFYEYLFIFKSETNIKKAREIVEYYNDFRNFKFKSLLVMPEEVLTNEEIEKIKNYEDYLLKIKDKYVSNEKSNISELNYNFSTDNFPNKIHLDEQIENCSYIYNQREGILEENKRINDFIGFDENSKKTLIITDNLNARILIHTLNKIKMCKIDIKNQLNDFSVSVFKAYFHKGNDLIDNKEINIEQLTKELQIELDPMLYDNIDHLVDLI